MTTIVFDIETGALAESELTGMLPKFDPADVKVGNLKDATKIAEKIAEAEANHRRDFFDRAALDPLTGRVVAIGMLVFDARGETGPDFTKFEATAPQQMDASRTTLTRPTDTLSHSSGRGTGGAGLTKVGSSPQPSPGLRPPSPAPASEGQGGRCVIIGHDDEARTLREFWEMTRGEMGRTNPLIGFNIFNFDLPFLFKRSWKRRVPIPLGLRRGRYWSDQLIDLRDCWQLGDRQARGSLDSIARHLGVGAKCVPHGPLNGKQITGADFAGLWQNDRSSAEAYLRNDLELTAKVAAALGVVI